MSGRRLRAASGATLDLGPEIARGGEAAIHELQGRPGELAKVYLTARPEMREKLEHMRARPPDDPARDFGHASIAWPRELLFDGKGALAGYAMPRIRDALPILEVFNPRRRERLLPGFDRRYLLRTARNLASALEALHEAGYVVGDLNERNILVTQRTLVTLIDTDSFQVQRQSGGQIVVYPCPVGRAEYTPPELQGQAFRGLMRRPEHDAFGLAVLIFQLLMDGNHPYRGRWLGAGDPPSLEAKIAGGRFPYDEAAGAQLVPPPGAPDLDRLGPDLAELCLACFVDGHARPTLRPSAGDWLQALEQAEDHLVACAEGHVFGDHLRRCPDCGGRVARRDLSEGGSDRPGLPGFELVAAAARNSLGLGRSAAIGLRSLPGRLRAGDAIEARTGYRSLAQSGGHESSASAESTLLEALARSLGASLLGLAAAGLLALVGIGLHGLLWSWLSVEGTAADGTAAGLWALLAGGVALAASSMVSATGGELLALFDRQLAAQAGFSALWSSGAWLLGWLLPAAALILLVGSAPAMAVLGAVGGSGAEIHPIWLVLWVGYGSLAGLQSGVRDSAPLAQATSGLVAGMIGWTVVQGLGLLLG